MIYFNALYSYSFNLLYSNVITSVIEMFDFSINRFLNYIIIVFSRANLFGSTTDLLLNGIYSSIPTKIHYIRPILIGPVIITYLDWL